jgi:hypothetical protein
MRFVGGCGHRLPVKRRTPRPSCDRDLQGERTTVDMQRERDRTDAVVSPRFRSDRLYRRQLQELVDQPEAGDLKLRAADLLRDLVER